MVDARLIKLEIAFVGGGVRGGHGCVGDLGSWGAAGDREHELGGHACGVGRRATSCVGQLLEAGCDGRSRRRAEHGTTAQGVAKVAGVGIGDGCFAHGFLHGDAAGEPAGEPRGQRCGHGCGIGGIENGLGHEEELVVGGRVLGDAHGREAGRDDGFEGGGGVLADVAPPACRHGEVTLHIVVERGLGVGITRGGKCGVPGQVVAPDDGTQAVAHKLDVGHGGHGRTEAGEPTGSNRQFQAVKVEGPLLDVGAQGQRCAVGGKVLEPGRAGGVTWDGEFAMERLHRWR